MIDILPLHPFQAEAIEAVDEQLNAGDVRTAVVLPTGSGKSYIFAHMARNWAEKTSRQLVILAHTDELVSQAEAEVRGVAPDLPIGVVKAERHEADAQIVIASVQTLRNRLGSLRNVGMTIVDECHHATSESYRSILRHYGCFDSTPAVGFTATLARGDRQKLGTVWQSVAYSKDIKWMIDNRYLIPPKGIRIEVDDLELNDVRQSRGDLQVGDLGRALEVSMAPGIAAKAYAEHAADRTGIVFTPTVSSAYVFAESFRAHGISSEVVHGALHPDERRAILRRLHTKETQTVVNCMALTEGFNEPHLGCVMIARPTRSAPLYQQLAGRGLRIDRTRPYDEQDCLILDIAGASQVHGLASLIDLSEPEPERKPGNIGQDGVVGPRDGKPIHAGATIAVNFNPLASRKPEYVWLETARGVQFIAGGAKGQKIYVFLLPRAGDTYDVAWCTQHTSASIDGKRGEVARKELSLDAAIAWGEELATEMGGTEHMSTLGANNRWRSNPRPSQSQLDLCTRLNIPLPEKPTRDSVSRAIETFFATGRITPIATWFATRKDR